MGHGHSVGLLGHVSCDMTRSVLSARHRWERKVTPGRSWLWLCENFRTTISAVVKSIIYKPERPERPETSNCQPHVPLRSTTKLPTLYSTGAPVADGLALCSINTHPEHLLSGDRAPQRKLLKPDKLYTWNDSQTSHPNSTLIQHTSHSRHHTECVCGHVVKPCSQPAPTEKLNEVPQEG